MQVFRDPQILPQELLLKEVWNMTPMQSATTTAIIMERIMTADITTVKVMTAGIITAMKAAAVITANKSSGSSTE